jgi:MFS superfamily sulfate permease-like transporter
VSPVVGLYAASAALVIYAAFGSSKHLVVGQMAATAVGSSSRCAALLAGIDRRLGLGDQAQTLSSWTAARQRKLARACIRPRCAARSAAG